MEASQITGAVSRRRLLRGAGVALALPLLESVTPRPSHADAASAAPRRLVAINIPLGFYGPSFFPQETGPAYSMTATLKPAESVREHFTVISGCSHPDVDGGHSAEASFLTAAPHPGARSFKNTISFDQMVAGQIGHLTRFASLTLGDHSLSWSANGVAIPAEARAERVFSRLFLRGTPEEIMHQQRQLEDGHSVLDVLREDARAMEPRLSSVDRQKLQQYFTALRDAEQRLLKAQAWAKTDKPSVDADAPEVLPVEHVTGRLKLHFDVILLALQTDSTRVVALGGHNGSLVPPIPGVEKGYHALTHHGQTEEMIQQLKLIDLETMRIWADFIARLQATREGDSTLLDRTHILCGSNLGNANAHTTTNLPVILAGGTYRHAGHLAFDAKNNQPLANVFLTMAKAMGIPQESFASSTGSLPGIEIGT